MSTCGMKRAQNGRPTESYQVVNDDDDERIKQAENKLSRNFFVNFDKFRNGVCGAFYVCIRHTQFHRQFEMN